MCSTDTRINAYSFPLILFHLQIRKMCIRDRPNCRPNPHLAALYEFDSSSRCLAPRSGQSEFAFLPNFFSGGSGLTSCVEDYLLFADALACGGVGADGSRILRPETIDLMRAEQLPAFRVDGSFSWTCGSDYGYGLGVRTRVAFDNGTPGGRGEFGWDGAAGAFLMAIPERRLSMFYVQHVLSCNHAFEVVHPTIRDLVCQIAQ